MKPWSVVSLLLLLVSPLFLCQNAEALASQSMLGTGPLSFLTNLEVPSWSRLCSNEPDTNGQHQPIHSFQHETARRRFLLAQVALFGSALQVSAASASTASLPPTNVFSDKSLSMDEATKRFLAAREDLKYLLENYSEITKSGNGDSVRNYLGTQGVNSNLYGIQKVLKVLTNNADDLVEYTETMEEFNAYYYQADGAAYQSLFVEYSSAKGSSEMYLATAKQDLVQLQKCMDRLAEQLNL